MPDRFYFVRMSQLKLSGSRMMMNRWFAFKIQIGQAGNGEQLLEMIESDCLNALGELACSRFYLR